MTKLLRYLLSFLLALLLYWCGIMFLIISARQIVRPLFESVPILTGLGTFLVGIFLFRKFHLTRFYVFGHELTHFLIAKLFLKDTGKINLGSQKGSVEVDRPNSIIVLAPYFIPFYVVLSLVIFLGIKFFCHSLSPVAYCGLGATIGLTWAYHIVLTLAAVGCGQKDFEVYGHFFSYGMIIAGNFFCLMAGILTLTSSWNDLIPMFQEISLVQYHAFLAAIRILKKGLL